MNAGKRPRPPAFKATVRTATMKAEMSGPSIAEGIEHCFWHCTPMERAKLIAETLPEVHRKLLDLEAKRATSEGLVA